MLTCYYCFKFHLFTNLSIIRRTMKHSWVEVRKELDRYELAKIGINWDIESSR